MYQPEQCLSLFVISLEEKFQGEIWILHFLQIIELLIVILFTQYLHLSSGKIKGFWPDF